MDKLNLKDARKKAFDNIEKRRKLALLAVSNFDKVVNDEDLGSDVFISIEQLRSLSVNERFKLNEGVEFTKLRETENELVFETIMIDGGQFTLHYHDCVEICKVITGSLIETQRGDVPSVRIYTEGERAIYDRNEKHSMHTTEYTLLEVKFIKNF